MPTSVSPATLSGWRVRFLQASAAWLSGGALLGAVLLGAVLLGAVACGAFAVEQAAVEPELQVTGGVAGAVVDLSPITRSPGLADYELAVAGQGKR